jgi:hypothetical protein
MIWPTMTSTAKPANPPNTPIAMASGRMAWSVAATFGALVLNPVAATRPRGRMCPAICDSTCVTPLVPPSSVSAL